MTKFKGNMADKNYIEYLNNCVDDPQFFVELTSLCNFKCFYCYSKDSPRDKVFINDEIFYYVINMLDKITKQPIRLHIDGEPTLHKNFIKYVNEINQKGYRVALVSNGSTLKAEYLDLLMDIGINISVSPEELIKRSNIEFKVYIERLRNYLIDWLKSDSKQHLNYNIYLTQKERRIKNAIISKLNFVREMLRSLELNDEINEESSNIYTYRKKNGFTLRFNISNIASGGLYPKAEFDLKHEIRKVSHFPISRSFGFCDSPWKRLAILADGRVSFCCIDLFGGTSFASKEMLLNSDLKELWVNHPQIIKVRNEMKKGKISNPICQKCLDRIPSREFYTRYYKNY